MIKSILLIGACVFSASILADTYSQLLPPGKSLQWNPETFCSITVQSYTDAFHEGERELVIMSLHESPTFKGLNPFQKSAFLRLVEAASEDEKQGIDAVESCKRQLKATVDSLVESRLKQCAGLYESAKNIIEGKSHPGLTSAEIIEVLRAQADHVLESKKDEWAKTIYYECLARN